MTRIVDLSMSIEDHFRWPVARSQKGDLQNRRRSPLGHAPHKIQPL